MLNNTMNIVNAENEKKNNISICYDKNLPRY